MSLFKISKNSLYSSKSNSRQIIGLSNGRQTDSPEGIPMEEPPMGRLSVSCRTALPTEFIGKMVEKEFKAKKGKTYYNLPLSFLSWQTDSNRRPADYKSAALPTELRQHYFLSRKVNIFYFSMQYVKLFFAIFI